MEWGKPRWGARSQKKSLTGIELLAGLKRADRGEFGRRMPRPFLQKKGISGEKGGGIFSVGLGAMAIHRKRIAEGEGTGVERFPWVRTGRVTKDRLQRERGKKVRPHFREKKTADRDRLATSAREGKKSRLRNTRIVHPPKEIREKREKNGNRGKEGGCELAELRFEKRLCAWGPPPLPGRKGWNRLQTAAKKKELVVATGREAACTSRDRDVESATKSAFKRKNDRGGLQRLTRKEEGKD